MTLSQSTIDQKEQTKQPQLSKNGLVFVFFAVLWQVAAAIIIGFFIAYDQTLFTVTSDNVFINLYVIVAMLIFIIVGFTLMSSYVTASSTMNMTLTFLIFLFTLQNWFIYRLLWEKIGLQRQDITKHTFGQPSPNTFVGYLPVNNDRRITDQYSTASFYDAIGPCIAMFCALSTLLGRIGFIQMFLLSWFGPFMYQINSSIFNKFYIVDNGFGMRGFLFGGLAGLVISFFIGKRQQSVQHKRFRSHYHTEALSFIGAVIVCLTYPTVITAGTLTDNESISAYAAVVQINAWLSLAGSIVGTFTACSLSYGKIYVHDIIFTSLSGIIAFSSSITLNYNPGAAIAIGSGVGFICSLIHTPLKKWVNTDGIRQSNSGLVQFVIPGTIACAMSAVLQAIDQSAIPGANIASNIHIQRSPSGQAGWQLIGFCFCLGSALIAGVILGLIMRCSHQTNHQLYFNDNRFIQVETKETIEARTTNRSRQNI